MDKKKVFITILLVVIFIASVLVLNPFTPKKEKRTVKIEIGGIVIPFAKEVLANPSDLTVNLTGGEVYVSGTYSVEVVPDKIMISITVIGRGKTAKDAVSKCAENTSKVISTILSFGIKKENIKSSYSLYPVYNYKEEPPKLLYYEARYIISFSVSDVEEASRIIDEVSSLKIEKINISFSVSRDEYLKAYNAALREAVKIAFNKALTIASTLNGTIESIVKVSEGGGYYTYSQPKLLTTEKTQIFPGTVSITANVNLVAKMKNH